MIDESEIKIFFSFGGHISLPRIGTRLLIIMIGLFGGASVFIQWAKDWVKYRELEWAFNKNGTYKQIYT